MEFNEKLQDLRKQKGLTQEELAEYLCVDRSAMTRELVKMKSEGLIDYDRNCFRIL